MVLSKQVVSIIIPVYNASQTLYECINSLHKQTYRPLELLFIDDCSTDHSQEVIQNISGQHSLEELSIKILHHEFNKGVAAARNTGLDNATGDYIYYVDADDKIDNDTIECLVKEAQEKDADIVGHDWFLTFNSNERYMKQPSVENPDDALKRMMCGRMKWNLWLYLVKRSLYEDNKIRFVEGWNMGEDMMVMMKLLSVANKMVMLHKPFYHYRQVNPEALTRTSQSEAHIFQVTNNIYELEQFLQLQEGKKYTKYIDILKLVIKWPLLITADKECYIQWRKWFPEANRYAFDNEVQSFRIRLLQYAAMKGQYWLIRLHYYGVIKLVYGVIYR
ncbi:MAG: glycosyltransferase [Bacteroides sp.]|nr:glycosyltransferase [Bacteroides sp.]